MNKTNAVHGYVGQILVYATNVYNYYQWGLQFNSRSAKKIIRRNCAVGKRFVPYNNAIKWNTYVCLGRFSRPNKVLTSAKQSVRGVLHND